MSGKRFCAGGTVEISRWRNHRKQVPTAPRPGGDAGRVTGFVTMFRPALLPERGAAGGAFPVVSLHSTTG